MNKYNFVYFDTLEDAENTLWELHEFAKDYYRVTKADVLDLMGLDSKYTDRRIFWTHKMLSEATIEPSAINAWTIVFPKPIDENTRNSMYREGRCFKSERYSKPEPKNLSIVLNSKTDNFADTLGCVFEYVSTVKDREVFITIT